MSRDLVTGATGFTGSHLVRRLLSEGREVVALHRASSDITELEALGVERRVADLADGDAVRRAFAAAAPIDRVYHVAATFRTQHPDPEEFRRVNAGGTRHVVQASGETGVSRLVHCSTVGVQGEIDDPPATEAYRTKPGDAYQRTKLEGEEIALGHGVPGLEVAVVRPVGIYGPGDRRFLKLFRTIDRGRMVMIGSGETLYHLTHVDDVVQGIVLAGRRPEAVDEVVTLAGARYTTLNELVALIAEALGVSPPRWRVPYLPVYAASVVCDRVCRALGVEPPLYPRRVEFFAKDRAFDITRARTLLGYRPAVDLPTGLAATAAWYRARGWL